jgi:hypothetical protein
MNCVPNKFKKSKDIGAGEEQFHLSTDSDPLAAVLEFWA